ncbi:phosphate/phosphite/phosphonate ABC transporter substrate-binding protein [Rhodopila sp.]|jgi:phosphonate transport system substrate-binding protein|uniref:phosphate/phosphite/phosphonate ABC transporter substrate-binding protein n=1 Tax=Rhodopila sp. TaxID=2480087 RepID=UPI002C37EA4E|nr:phosphate/phosphite/phosphonate ABC transporter substrate-binding protein [Rhodopila sp.]HVZ06875.1 phosphate/phosphite/phosphonate ABC transporter substrate-binding protein [Rhodopila sp.]
MVRRLTYLFAAACALILVSQVWASHARAQDWKAQMKEFRLGLLGGENTQARLARYDGFQKLLQENLGIPVKLYPAADYAGVMQAIAAGQLDGAEFSPSAFAGAWLDCKCVGPTVVPLERDGTIYYIAVMITRADSGIRSIADMKGHSLAWADPNSASGYLIPAASLRKQGIDLSDGAYFSRTGFAGGHEQGIIAVLNKQYDACVTWTSGQGDEAQGFSRGALRGMVDRGMLHMSDVRIIWKSARIPNGPWGLRGALPAGFKQVFTAFMMDLPKSHKDIYDAIEQGVGIGYVPASMDMYKDLIELREAERSGNRG